MKERKISEERANEVFCQMANEEYFGFGLGDLFLHLNHSQYIKLLKKLGIILDKGGGR